MCGAGLSTTVDADDFVLSATAVAVTVMLELLVTDGGALYLAAVLVTLVKVPQALPVHPAPEALHFTPALVVSWVTLAVKSTVCPWSMVI
jgi:hypothetical protein